MIVYRDMTFCTARCLTADCPRRLTKEIVEKAQAAGMELAFCNLSEGCPDYEPVEE